MDTLYIYDNYAFKSSRTYECREQHHRFFFSLIFSSLVARVMVPFVSGWMQPCTAASTTKERATQNVINIEIERSRRVCWPPRDRPTSSYDLLSFRPLIYNRLIFITALRWRENFVVRWLHCRALSLCILQDRYEKQISKRIAKVSTSQIFLASFKFWITIGLCLFSLLIIRQEYYKAKGV